MLPKNGDVMSARKVLSPAQIALGSVWGGPLAAVYFLRKNYIAIGNEDYAQKSLVLGIIFVALLVGVLPFLPENFPRIALPLAYSLGARAISEATQLKKDQIKSSAEYEFESNWKIFGIGAITLIMGLVIIILSVFVFDAIGITSDA